MNINENSTKLSRKDILIIIIVPIFSILFSGLVSYFTAKQTIKASFELEELKFKQNAIQEIIITQNLTESRKKIGFLLNAKLIEDKDSSIFQSLSQLRYKAFAFEDYLKGTLLSDSAYNIRSNRNKRLELFKEAILYYTKSIESDPYNELAYRSRGWCYQKVAFEGDNLEKSYFFHESIKDYDKSLEINPNHTTCYYLKGLSQLNVDMNMKARKNFQKSFELDSTVVEPFLYLGYLELKDGNTNIAKDYIHQALQNNYKAKGNYNYVINQANDIKSEHTRYIIKTINEYLGINNLPR